MKAAPAKPPHPIPLINTRDRYRTCSRGVRNFHSINRALSGFIYIQAVDLAFCFSRQNYMRRETCALVDLAESRGWCND